jgi:NADPH2:quinone reductase
MHQEIPMSVPPTGLQLQSLVTQGCEVHLTLARVPVAAPAADEVVIRVEAAPINPSDLGVLLGPADVSRMRTEGAGDDVRIVVPMPPQGMRMMAARVGQALAVGTEGSGVVVAAGSAPQAQELMGRVVAVAMGSMYAEYRVAKVADVLPTRSGTTSEQAASSFVNPLTALSMIETMRREAHTALVHTAAASNLGQMLNRLCINEGIGLVNIVRGAAQAKVLKEIGAKYVVESVAPTFPEDLLAAVEATNATLGFDAIGGGKLAAQILTAMEAAQSKKLGAYSRYGSTVHKQVYIYGGLDLGPTELARAFGMAWGVGGWLLPNSLTKFGPKAASQFRKRVAEELTTTFVSRYTQTISLREALKPEVIVAYHRRATGEKYLIAPNK